MDCKHASVELPGLSLDCLEPVERQQVLSHIQACTVCRSEWQAYREVVGDLSTILLQVAPPSHVKTSLMTRLAPPGKKSGLSEILRNWFTGSGALLRVAGVMLILVLVISNLFFWQKANQLGQMQQYGYNSLVLRSPGTSSGATGMIVYTTDGRYGLLVVNKLSALPDDQQYQLWLIKNGNRTNGGIFSVGKHGYFVMEIDSPERLTDYDTFGITIEPAGGSPEPTGARVLAGSL